MKKNLLLLASLAVLASSASAASNQSDVLVLPTFVVQAPRQQILEQRINANLDELRSHASASAIIPLELPALKAQVTRPGTWSQAVQNNAMARLAKS